MKVKDTGMSVIATIAAATILTLWSAYAQADFDRFGACVSRSGLYNNPSRVGHGLQIDFQRSGGRDLVVVNTLGYESGRPVWLQGVGVQRATTAAGRVARVAMRRFSGGTDFRIPYRRQPISSAIVQRLSLVFAAPGARDRVVVYPFTPQFALIENPYLVSRSTYGVSRFCR